MNPFEIVEIPAYWFFELKSFKGNASFYEEVKYFKTFEAAKKYFDKVFFEMEDHSGSIYLRITDLKKAKEYVELKLAKVQFENDVGVVSYSHVAHFLRAM
jgi:hypothetical protein